MVSGRRIEPKRITSRANGAFKELRSARVGFGGEIILVEGAKLIEEARTCGMRPTSAWSHGPWPISFDCPSYEVPLQMYEVLSPTRSGQAPLAVFPAPKLHPLRVDSLLEGRYLLLDRIQEPGNAGALVRAAAAFGIQGVIWQKPCAYPFHHATIRASAGCCFQVSHWVCDQLPLEVHLPVLGAAGEADAVSLPEYQWPEHFILAMGNEGQGLSDSLRERLSQKISIPMMAGVESLNVAGAAHILMYDAWKAGRTP